MLKRSESWILKGPRGGGDSRGLHAPAAGVGRKRCDLLVWGSSAASPLWLGAIWRLYQDEHVWGRKITESFSRSKKLLKHSIFFSVIELLHIPI